MIWAQAIACAPQRPRFHSVGMPHVMTGYWVCISCDETNQDARAVCNNCHAPRGVPGAAHHSNSSFSNSIGASSTAPPPRRGWRARQTKPKPRCDAPQTKVARGKANEKLAEGILAQEGFLVNATKGGPIYRNGAVVASKKSDLFDGCIDLIAIRGDAPTKLVQVTTSKHMPERKRKIESSPCGVLGKSGRFTSVEVWGRIQKSDSFIVDAWDNFTSEWKRIHRKSDPRKKGTPSTPVRPISDATRTQQSRSAESCVVAFGDECPLCPDGVLKQRFGPWGLFLGCSNFYNRDDKCTYKLLLWARDLWITT